MRNLFIAATLLLSACGISNGTELGSLDKEDAIKLCEEAEARTIECGEGDVTWTIELNGDCSDAEAPPETCTATVGDWRDCVDAWDAMSDDEICAAESTPSACAAVYVDACISAE